MGLKTTIAIGAAAGLLLLATGIGVGRYTAPARVEYREHVVTKTVEVAAKQKEESRAEATRSAERTDTRRVVYEVRHIDGTVERTATTETGRSVQADTSRTDTKREVEVRYVDRVVEKETVKVTQASRPAWGAGLIAGISTSLQPRYGAEVARRIIGPVWLAAWADTSKTAGLAVRVEF